MTCHDSEILEIYKFCRSIHFKRLPCDTQLNRKISLLFVGGLAGGSVSAPWWMRLQRMNINDQLEMPNVHQGLEGEAQCRGRNVLH